jgi:hypothetical protein
MTDQQDGLHCAPVRSDRCTDMEPNRLVTLINPNKIHPAITPYALDILTTSLEAAGLVVDVVDLTFHREITRGLIGVTNPKPGSRAKASALSLRVRAA